MLNFYKIIETKRLGKEKHNEKLDKQKKRREEGEILTLFK